MNSRSITLVGYLVLTLSWLVMNVRKKDYQVVVVWFLKAISIPNHIIRLALTLREMSSVVLKTGWALCNVTRTTGCHVIEGVPWTVQSMCEIQGECWAMQLRTEYEIVRLAFTIKAKFTRKWDNRLTPSPPLLSQRIKQRNSLVMPLFKPYLVPTLNCVCVCVHVFLCGLLDLCVCDWWIAAAAGSVCFLGELSAEEETRPEAHHRPQAWSAGWSGAHTTYRNSW